jgi:isocitrate/isopropylmalate dehydrogenase
MPLQRDRDRARGAPRRPTGAGRRRKIHSVDKANVLETSRLWRSVVDRICPANFPT